MLPSWQVRYILCTVRSLFVQPTLQTGVSQGHCISTTHKLYTTPPCSDPSDILPAIKSAQAVLRQTLTLLCSTEYTVHIPLLQALNHQPGPITEYYLLTYKAQTQPRI